MINMSVQSEYTEIENEDTSFSGEIKRPFDPKRIDITTKQMILEVIFRRLRNNEINLKTFFQRNPDLWDKTKQSRLIESILIKLPLPAFYFDGTNDNEWLIVDGLQRLSTFKNYVIENKFKLQDLEYLKQFNKKSFGELPRDLQRRIEEHEITVYIINPGTPKEVKFNLFRRINTGGLILTTQEIRHALNQGIPSDFISLLAKKKEFRRYAVNPKRMLDRDFATRFVAFYLHNPNKYKPDLDGFLNNSMAELENLTDSQRKNIEMDFITAMDRANKLFGIHAFRKRYFKHDRRKPINKALFEVWSVILSRLQDEKFQTLLNKKDVLNEEFMKMLNKDYDFEKSITTSTGTPRNVKKRFNSISELISKVVK